MHLNSEFPSGSLSIRYSSPIFKFESNECNEAVITCSLYGVVVLIILCPCFPPTLFVGTSNRYWNAQKVVGKFAFCAHPTVIWVYDHILEMSLCFHTKVFFVWFFRMTMYFFALQSFDLIIIVFIKACFISLSSHIELSVSNNRMQINLISPNSLWY